MGGNKKKFKEVYIMQEQDVYIYQIVMERIEGNYIIGSKVMESIKSPENALRSLQEWTKYYELDIRARKAKIHLTTYVCRGYKIWGDYGATETTNSRLKAPKIAKHKTQQM